MYRMMKALLFTALLAQVASIALAADGAGTSPAPPQVKGCVGCHGVDGGAMDEDDDTTPRISGLGDGYFAKSMYAYLRKARHDEAATYMYKVECGRNAGVEHC
jgi:cytochrome c553